MNIIARRKVEAEGQFTPELLDWYDQHAREMPWRIAPSDYAQGVRQNPYKVWLSEIMLQQTQVITVRDYFLKFISHWPTVHDLAEATLEDVLKAWAGLGYYSRARNLKKCAEQLVSDFGGQFPQNKQELIKLPGIGDYTSSAIAAIAFDEAVPVIDGNIERVMTRMFRLETPVPKVKKPIAELLVEHLDHDRPGEFAQAMMDLGATICSPKSPKCSICPVSRWCGSFGKNDVERFPVKKPKKKKPVRKGAAFVIFNRANNIWLCKRPMKGLLAGMTQVPTTDWNSTQDGETGFEAAPTKTDWHFAGTAKHTFTHFHLELEVWTGAIDDTPPIDGWWCDQQSLKDQALPNVMNKVIDRALANKVKKAD